MSEIKSILYAPLDESLRGRAGLPLHVTVLPPFRHDTSRTEELIECIRHATLGAQAVRLVGEQEEFFGTEEQIHRREIRVRRFSSEVLSLLHQQVLAGALGREFAVDTTFAGERYAPHSTYIGDSGIAEGQAVFIDRLRLAQRRRGENWRDIERYELGETAS